LIAPPELSPAIVPLPSLRPQRPSSPVAERISVLIRCDVGGGACNSRYFIEHARENPEATPEFNAEPSAVLNTVGARRVDDEFGLEHAIQKSCHFVVFAA
jgi:hypothetical protein